MIVIDKISKSYCDVSNMQVSALKNINLSFKNKGMVFIQGKSGCGKTTLLNMIGGLDVCDSGDIIVDNKSILNMSGTIEDEYRNQYLGFIFQDYSLLEQYSVKENILLPLKIRENINKNDKKQKLEEVMEYVGLSGYENRMPNELSGGQKQRVAIARTLIKDPILLLADEPTGNLDEKNSEAILSLLKKLSKNLLIIIVSHNNDDAIKYADRIIKMSDGEVISDMYNDSAVNYQYTLTSYWSNGQKEFVNLGKKEVISNIESLMFDCSRRNYRCYFSISGNKKQEDNNTEENIRVNSNYESKALDFQTIMNLVIGNFKHKKMRAFFTVLMISIISTLVILLCFLTAYEKNKVIQQFMKKNNCYMSGQYKEIKYHNSEDNTEQSIVVSNGYSLYNDINKEINFDFLASVKHESTLCEDYLNNEILNVKGKSVSIYFVDSNNSNYKYIGKFPQKIDEILITDYEAEEVLKIKDPIGKTVLVDETVRKVVGIIQTDYKNYKYIDMINQGNYNGIVDYDLFSKFLIVVMNKENLSEMLKDKCIYLDKGNFLFDSEKKQINNSIFIAKYSDEELFFGKKPERDNEIVISYNVAVEMGFIASDDTQMTNAVNVHLIDLYNDTYNGENLNSLNLYDYFENGNIKIVGIVKDDESTDNAMAYFYSNIYLRIERDYLNYYYVDEFITYYSDMSKYLYSIEKSNWIINNPIVGNIYLFDNTIRGIALLLYVIIIMLLMVLFLLIVSYISYSIKDSSRNIGILRTLGVTMKDTLQIYIQEAIIISSSSIACAIAGIYVLLLFINNEYCEKVLEYNTTLICWNVKMLLAIIAFILIISFIAAVIPIRKLSRKYPVQIMKGK